MKIEVIVMYRNSEREQIVYFGNNDYRNYLMHYGVKGMKWGVRRQEKLQDRYASRVSDYMAHPTTKNMKRWTKTHKKYERKYGKGSIEEMEAKKMSGKAVVNLMFKNSDVAYAVIEDEGYIKYRK